MEHEQEGEDDAAAETAVVADGAKILLIDDDADLRQMYTLILNKAGHEVITANDGVQGLAKAREGGFDLILLDLMMPNMDGLGFMKSIQDEQPQKANGPTVVLSNAGYNEVAKEAESLGAVGFMMKADMLPDDLTEEVARYLAK